MDASSSAPSLQNPTVSIFRPSKSTAFKREDRRKRKERKRQEKLLLLLDDWNPLEVQSKSAAPCITAVSTAEWPSEQVSDQNLEIIGWNLKSRIALPSLPRPAALFGDLAQEKALRLCREFFSIEDCSEEEDGADDGDNEGKSYDFFKGLFEKEEDLMDFYRNDREQGKFYCLACGGIGEKIGKKFVSLAALLQHANFILKTKSIIAHRAYGRVVCELSGFEINDSTFVDDSASDTRSQVDMEEEDNNQEEVTL